MSRPDHAISAAATGEIDALTAGRSDPRLEPFGYVCGRCSNCCRHVNIQVNPYEVARLARNLGQTAAEFRAAWTRDGAGAALKQTETGACMFLGPEGCTVHADRPLVCRVYPLGRHLSADGTEWFSHMTPHPMSAGAYTARGTIAEYLATQGAAPFLQAAEEYFFWLCEAAEFLDRGFSEQEFLGDEAGPRQSEEPERADALLDMDAAIARHCAATRGPEPTSIEDRKRLHLTILYQQIGQHERRRT